VNLCLDWKLEHSLFARLANCAGAKNLYARAPLPYGRGSETTRLLRDLARSSQGVLDGLGVAGDYREEDAGRAVRARPALLPRERPQFRRDECVRD
jgi:hypothetical protein